MRHDPAPRIGVAFVVSSLFMGGAEAQVIQLASALDTGFRPLIICTKGEGEQAQRARAAGLRVVSLGLRSGKDPRLLPRLTRLLREFRPAIVHCTNFDSTVWGRAAGVLAKVPCIVTAEHSSTRPRSHAPSRVAIPLANRAFAKRTDCVVACSHAQVPLLKREGNPPDRVRVIPNGVDLRLYDSSHSDADVREECGVPEGAVAIGIVARLFEEKNVAMLLRVASRLQALDARTHFVIVGDGPCRPALEDLVREARLTDAVTFTGTRHDVPRVLTGMDICALTSSTEAFPISLLEAMAAGLPVVATDVGDVARIVKNGSTGFVVAAGDTREFTRCLETLVRNPGLREAMGSSGRLRVEKLYSVDRMTQAYTELFERILCERGVERHIGGSA